MGCVVGSHVSNMRGINSFKNIGKQKCVFDGAQVDPIKNIAYFAEEFKASLT